MVRYSLIDAYVASLRRRVRWRPDVDALVAEVEDHLYSTIERLEAGGIDAHLAQRAALERFGDPDLVARAYAAAPNGGLAMPTSSTRTAGAYAISSAVLWLAVISAWWVTGLIEPRYEWRAAGLAIAGALDALGGVALLGATSLMVAAMVGLDRRHGGLGALGASGLLVAGVGLVAALLAWVFTGWGTLAMIGTLLFATAMWRQDVAPRLPTLLFAGGPIVGAIAWSILRGAQGTIDLSGFWGEHWLANQMGLSVGGALLALGLLGLGRWLRSEEPAGVDSTDGAVPA
jgi:HAAS